MEQAYFKEVFDYPISEFKNHLEWESNERIIFSGKYGMGKTSFLKNYFSEENQKALYGLKKYSVYKLFPTNYSIASNHDIIRYIKYDIIIEMLKHSITIEEVKLKLQDTLPSFILKELDKVIAALVYMIPKVGKEIVDVFEKIDKLKDDFLEYHDQINKSHGDKLVEYLEALEAKEGSIYENDVTTKIITEVISSDTTTEKILLIDDVDRLDPEHIFRILNVFASHFDSNHVIGAKNKFDFDKIIIVCDFNNIRNIFHHRYGNETDFLGYIDKFYSCDVHYFDNKNAVQEIIAKIFSSIVLLESDSHTEPIYRSCYFNNEFLIGIISSLLYSGHISLRNIVKLYKRKIAYHTTILQFPEKHIQLVAWRLPVTMQVKLLKDFFGDYHSMKSVMLKLSNQGVDTGRYNNYFGSLIYLLSYRTHLFSSRRPCNYTYKGKKFQIDAKFNFSNDQVEQIYLYEDAIDRKNADSADGQKDFYCDDKIFFETLVDSMELMNSIGFLR